MLLLLAVVSVRPGWGGGGGCRLAEAGAAQAASSRALLLSGRERPGGLAASQMAGPDSDLSSGPWHGWSVNTGITNNITSSSSSSGINTSLIIQQPIRLYWAGITSHASPVIAGPVIVRETKCWNNYALAVWIK